MRMIRHILTLMAAAFLLAAPTFGQDKTITKPVLPQKSTSTTTSTRKSSTTTTTKSSGSSASSQVTGSSGSSTSKQVTESSTSMTTTTKEATVQPSKPTRGYIDGHEYVDLGLSVKWATCNVGASSPSDYGNYYAWGETSTKSSYDEENSRTYDKSMGDIAGNPSYDAARANWGGSWRMPTKDEIGELISKCSRKWTTLNGHYGYKITGPNGNSIFLPAAGRRLGTSLYATGEGGGSWGSTPHESDTDRAYYLYFGVGLFGRYWRDRGYGQSVRPVSE